jgi:hypothetical protein
MNAFVPMLADLRNYQTLSRELLSLAEQESQALRQGETARLREISAARKDLLPRLSEALEKLRGHRRTWQGQSTTERSAQPEIAFLIRQTQDLIMRAILLDRENEQGLLRRGLIPARELPSASPQRSHFVADLYRRQPAA